MSNSSGLGYLVQLTVPTTIYAVEGVLMILGNGLILLAIARHKTLHRKEMASIGCLAAVDVYYGVAWLATALRRLKVLYVDSAEQRSEPYSGWDCFNLATATLMTAFPAEAVVLVVVSVDRYLAVVKYTDYLSYGAAYVKKVIAFTACWLTATCAALWLSSYLFVTRERRFNSFCITGWAVHPIAAVANNVLFIVGGYTSVVIYALVWRRHGAHMAERRAQAVRTDAQWQRHARLTHTLGVLAVCTLLLHCLPAAVATLTNALRISSLGFSGMITPYLYMLMAANPLVNAFVYLRNRELREAMLGVVRGQKVHAELKGANRVKFVRAAAVAGANAHHENLGVNDIEPA